MSQIKTCLRRSVDSLSLLIVLAALAVIGRTFLQGRSAADVGQPLTRDIATGEWFYELAGTGNWIGPRDAPVIVLVFSSYYCGFCAAFNENLSALRIRYPQHLALVFKHFVVPTSLADSKVPLGVECAAGQGRFRAYHTSAFRYGRLRIYTDGWRTLADSAGVPDLDDFEVCVRGGRYVDEVIRDFEAGKEAGVSGTPTFFINAQGPFVGTAPFERLDSLVAAHFRGRSGGRDLSSR